MAATRLGCDALAPGGCSAGVCEACCNSLAHFALNATGAALQCAACVAHECGDGQRSDGSLRELLDHLTGFFAEHTEAVLTLLAALPVAGRLSDYWFRALRRRLCPRRKVIVMSCPERGTRRADGAGPYNEDVMAKVAELQQRGVLKMGFDRAGSSTQHPADRDVDWSNALSIRGSQWMYGFQTAAKKVMAVESQGFDGILVVVCIEGGPVTRVEHEVMGSIIAGAQADAAQSGVTCRIDRRDLSYVQFLREHDEGCVWRLLCCWCPRCLRGVLRGILGCECCRHPGRLCGGGQNNVPADGALSQALLQQPHGSGSERSAGGAGDAVAAAVAAAAAAGAAAAGSAGAGLSRPASPEGGGEDPQAVAVEPERENPVGQVVWVGGGSFTPWIRGEVEGHDEASGKPLVRAVEKQKKKGGFCCAEESAAKFAAPRVWNNRRTAAPGFTCNQLMYSGSSWAAARDGNDLSPRQAVAQAAVTLLLWHALQPALYAYVFSDAFSTLEPVQRWLGGFVLLREALYLLAVGACAWVNPAFLLVDVGASVRDEDVGIPFAGGYLFLTMYVVAPEKYVGLALFLEGGLDKDKLSFVVVALLGPLLDLCGLGALGAGLGAGAGGLPPALAVGYTVTALGALFMAWFAVVEAGIKNGEEGALRIGLLGTACILAAFFVPFALAR